MSDGFDFGCGAGERRERSRVWNLGKVLGVGDEDKVGGELAGGGFVLFGVAEEPSGRDRVEGVTFDEVVVMGVDERGEWELKERSVGDDGEERAGLLGEMGGYRGYEDLVEAAPGGEFGGGWDRGRA